MSAVVHKKLTDRARDVGYFVAALVLFALAGGAKGCADELQFHYDTSFAADYEKQQFWNPELSHRNKWETDAEGRVVTPRKEAFLGSSTVFVAWTDGWHALQSIEHNAERLAAALLIVALLFAPGRRRVYYFIVAFLILWVVQAGAFHLTYHMP